MFNAFLQLSRFKKRVISVTVDFIALSFALWASFALRLDVALWEPDKAQLLISLLTVVFTLGVFVRLGLYRAVIRYMSDRAFITIITGVAASTLLLVLLSYGFNVFVPRSVPLIYAALAFIFVGGSRMSMRMLVQYSSGRDKERVAIIGAGKTAVQLAKALQQGDEYHPVMFISLIPANHKTLIVGLPAFALSHLKEAVSSHRVERLLLAVDADMDVNRRELLTQLEKLNLPVQTVPSFSEVIAGQARINDIRDLEIEDLLGRDPVRPDNAQVASSLFDRSVMVTGAGGSIGSELCRQIIRHQPKCLVLFEQSEFALYAIERELQQINLVEGLNVCVHPLLGSVVHRRRCEAVMRSFGVQTVYHAAAYKHVPLVEHNVIEGVQNNVFGTLHAAEAAVAAGVELFVLISTDKAVRPTNVMGASKRMAELVLQGLAQRQSDTVFSMVRFGNVLGSSGSVVPLFRDQISSGGPVTVTHPDIIRYFMTIPEASQLVLQAGSMGQGGEVFVLDMGEPVKIADLARKMMHLMGRRERTAEQPDGEIELVFSGLRPGEKLFEELLIGDDPQGTAHPRIMMAREVCMSWPEVADTVEQLQYASQTFDCEEVLSILKIAPTGFAPNCGVGDLVWNLSRRPMVAGATDKVGTDDKAGTDLKSVPKAGTEDGDRFEICPREHPVPPAENPERGIIKFAESGGRMTTNHHDTGYKELFSHPEFVQQLIEGFAPFEIADLMDFSTLKNHSGNYITPLFEEKFEDVVWSVEVSWEGITQRVFLYILLEFQSKVDSTMPLRLMHYVACFYDHLLKTRETTPRQGLPPIFPMVLYNGSKRWSARQDIYEMVQPEPPEFLRAYQPHLRYYLIDEGRYTDEELICKQTPLSGVFGVENAGHSWEALQQAVDRVVKIIEADPSKERVDKIITRWIKRHLSRLGAEVGLERLNSLVEDRDMLAENLENLVKKERLEGRQEGRQETARNLINRTEMNDQMIAEIAGLTIDEVSQLRSAIKH